MEGSSILRRYGNSLKNALKSIYPEYKWDDSKFPQVPTGFWKDPAIQKQSLEAIGKKLGVEKLDDWYSVKYIFIPALDSQNL